MTIRADERKGMCPCMTKKYMSNKGLDKQLSKQFGKEERKTKPKKKTIKQLFIFKSK